MISPRRNEDFVGFFLVYGSFMLLIPTIIYIVTWLKQLIAVGPRCSNQ